MGIHDVNEIIKSCRFCFMCRHACPTFLATKLDSHTPRGYALLLSQIAEGYREWRPSTVDRFYQCSQCGLCREDCAYHWQEDELVRHAREEIVHTGHAPDRVTRIASALIAHDRLYDRETRSHLPTEAVGKTNVDVLYFAGCSARQHHPEIIAALSTIFQAAGIQWGTLQHETCCGTPLYELGYTQEAKETARKAAAAIAEANPKILLTGCAHCFRAFKEWYPQWGIDISATCQIVHSSQYLDTLIADGAIPFDDKRAPASVCYHDPCQLGRKIGEYEAPRRLIVAATGNAPVELFHNKEHAECCGAGSIMFLTDPEVAGKVAQKRIERVCETGAEAIITACQNCKTNFINAQRHRENPVKVLDIAELIAARVHL